MRIQRSLQTMAVWLLPALLMPDAQLKKNRIIIISTHDKNIVDLADVTINLDKGHIFEAEVL